MDGCWSGKARQLLELPRSLLAQQLVQGLERQQLVLVPEQRLEPELAQQQRQAQQLVRRLAWQLV